MPSMWVRVAGQVSAVVLWGLIASGGMASAQDDPESGDGVQAGGFPQPNVGDRHILWPFGASDKSIRVYGAVQNESTSDPDEHVYLYEPPLRFRVAADGTIDVRRNDFDPRKVVFYLEGLNQDLEKRIQELLDEKGIKVLPRNVRALQYTFIALSDDSGQWRSRYPEDDGPLPAPQDWIPFEVDFTEHEDGEDRANEFVNRLQTQEVEFDVTLGYVGSDGIINSLERMIQVSFSVGYIGETFGFTISSWQGRSGVGSAMTLTIPEVVGVLGLVFAVVFFIWRRLDTVSEAMRKAHDGIATRIDGLREHMDAKFEGFSARNAAIEKEAAFTRGKLEGLAQGGGRFAASAPDPPAKKAD